MVKTVLQNVFEENKMKNKYLYVVRLRIANDSFVWERSMNKIETELIANLLELNF